MNITLIKARKLTFLAFLFASIAQLNAQEADLKANPTNLTPVKTDTVVGWKSGGTFMLNLNQTSLSNYWAAGGQNSIAINSMLNIFADYKKENSALENTFQFGYGIVRQGDKTVPFIKNDDRIDLSSKYGRKINDKLYYSGLFNFKSQFSKGFKSPTDSVYISKFLAPGYMILAFGLDLKPNKDISVLLAPITAKGTLVLDETLSDAGAFGVRAATYDALGVKLENGEKFRKELGIYSKIVYNKVSKDKKVSFNSKVELFSNYLSNFGDIDVNWENLLTMKVNKFVAFNFATQVIYDDDIKFPIDKNEDGTADGTGPRMQFKQIFGAGLTFKF